MGAPFEFAYPDDIPAKGQLLTRFGRLMDYPKGTVTDDTQMAAALARSLIERGRVDGEDVAQRFADLWRTARVIGPGLACSQAVGRLLGGVEWDHAGCAEGSAGNGTAMRVAPVGLFRCHDVGALVEDARTQSIITHTDDRAVAGAVVVARAVSLNAAEGTLDQAGFVEELARVARPHSPAFAEDILKLPEWLTASEDEAVNEIARAGQPDFSKRVITPFVLPTVLASLYAFLRTPEDYCESVTFVVRLGGDADSTGAITGSVSGSLNGEAGFPERLVRQLRWGRGPAVLADEMRLLADELLRLATAP
jgi:ADP-ribosylglycohydrolase